MSPRNRSEVKGQTSLRLSTGHRGQTSLLSASATSLQSTSTLSEAITHVSLTEKRFSNAQISLFNWIFKFCRDEFAVHLEGNAKSHMNRTVTCRSAAITHRLQPNLLKSKSGKLYQLQGPICRLSCEMLGYPGWLIDEFFHGFPENWKTIMEKYFRDRKRLRSAYTLSSWLEALSSQVNKRKADNSLKGKRADPKCNRAGKPQRTTSTTELAKTRVFRNGVEVVHRKDKTTRVSPGNLSSDPSVNLVYDHDLISFCSQSPDTSVVSGVSTNSSIGPSASCIGAQNPLPAPPKSFDFGRIVAVSAPYGKLPTTSVAPIKPTQVVSPVANTKVCQTKRKLSEFYTSPKRSSRQISPAKPQQQRLIIKSGKENNSSQMTLTVKPNASGVSSQRTPQFNWKRSATVSTDQSSSSDDDLLDSTETETRRRSPRKRHVNKVKSKPIKQPDSNRSVSTFKAGCRWSVEEEELLKRAMEIYRPKTYYRPTEWEPIAALVKTRSADGCGSHARCYKWRLYRNESPNQPTDVPSKVAVRRQNSNCELKSPKKKQPKIVENRTDVVAKKGTLKWRNEVRQLVTQAVRQPHGKLTENDDYFDYHPNVVQTKLFTFPGLSDSILGKDLSVSSAATPSLNNTGRFFTSYSGSERDTPVSTRHTNVTITSADRRNVERYLYRTTKEVREKYRIQQPNFSPKCSSTAIKKSKKSAATDLVKNLVAAEGKRRRVENNNDSDGCIDEQDVYFSDSSDASE